MRMKTFEIQYKCYYGETSDYGCEYVRARDKNAALRKFARSRGMYKVDLENVDNWRWESGVWFEKFKYIQEVDVIPCPHCGGTGEVAIYPEDNKSTQVSQI